MKAKFILILAILFIALGGGLYFKNSNSPSSPITQTLNPISSTDENNLEVTTVAEGLDTPWALVFLPDYNILVTERPGRVRLIKDGRLEPLPVATLEKVREIGEGGLLGMTIHPNFSTNHYLYFYYTYSSSGDNTLNRVVRMTYQDEKLTDEKIIVDKIPGAANHNGGRIKFGPDNFLYIATGDAQEPSLAQNKESLAGKILRVTDEGEKAPGNPFENLVYSYGHRNIQGLTWRGSELWATEHGRSGVLSGLDELNLIIAGGNYGWPEIQGSETQSGMIAAKLNSGSTTWAPAGIIFLNNSFYFGGLRGQALYEIKAENSDLKIQELFKSQFGRIREVTELNNILYLTTSNQDGRGTPSPTDDKVLKIYLKK